MTKAFVVLIPEGGDGKSVVTPLEPGTGYVVVNLKGHVGVAQIPFSDEKEKNSIAEGLEMLFLNK